jgi:type VI secretion system secreted protein VgrG
MAQKPKKANEARFFFFCGSLDSSTFEVLNFTGADRVSAPYEFRILLISSKPDISPDDVVNKQASLFMYRDQEFYPYSGIVSEFEFVDRTVDYATYSVTLVSALWLLNLNVQTRIFQKKKAPQIVKDVLDAAGMKNYYTVDVDNGKYPEHEYIVQYQESDLNFIQRIMEEHGIWYFFNENPVLPEELDGKPGAEALFITDKPAKFEMVATQSNIIYRAHSGLTERVDEEYKESVHRLSHSKQVVPKEVLAKNYNYRTPEVDLSSTRQVKDGAVGSVYEYGGLAKDTTEVQHMAEIAAARLSCRQIVLDGSSNSQGLRAGKRFTLQEHFRDDFNAAYVVTSVHHSGAHTTTDGSARLSTYVNRFQCIPSAKADLFRPERTAMIPRVNGIMTAFIEADGSDYAALDDQGRYKVRMPFDISDAENYSGSKYMRLAQPYSGSSYGMHFPSHEGAEMVFGCIDGDPSKPLGLGTVPNANTISPVVSSNKEQSVIRTAGGNEMCMDDTDGKQKIRFTTKGKHVIEQDDENKRIAVQSTDKNALILDDKNKKVSWNADKHSMVMDYDKEKCITISTGDGHTIRIDDKNKCVTIQTKAGHMVELDDNGKKITLTDCKGANTVQLDGSKGLILESKEKISIKASKDLEISAANIKMSTSQGKIDVKATSDLNLSGMKINVKATSDLKMEGLKLAAKGTTGVQIGGLKVDIKADVAATFKGVTAEVGADAMTTIKGGVVMIN